MSRSAPFTISAETRRILALAWPVALTSLNWTILHLTDVVVVGLVSTDEVAALGASRSLTFVTIVTGLAWLSGILVFVSRADGAGDLKRTGGVLREGLVLALLLGSVSALLLSLFAAPMLAGMGVAEALVGPAARVVQAMALSYPFQMAIVAASFFLEGVSRPRRVMTINLIMLPFNALLAWAMSGGHLGFPVMGAVGAATATAIASAFGAVGMIGAVWTLPRAAARGVHDFSQAAWRGVPAGAARLALFGAVPAIASGLELAGFSILIALSTQLGDITAHAFQIVFSIHNVTFGVALGLGSAAGVRAGNAVGEGDAGQAIPRTLIAAAVAAVATGLLAVILVVARAPLVAAFPAAGEVHVIALAMLPVWAPFILFDGVQVVFVYALRSLGDQVVAGANSIIAFFLVTGGAGWWLLHHGVGPMGLVYASGLGMVAATLLHGARFWMISAALRRRSSAPAFSN
ncbi:MATE family efflux transporter [Sphingomonas alpina]|uniref:MATE family efflux transporter n=1 Tax=Sphingomonas alpina TaxID=653931 RepID=A0A7H0LH36_9SPHN|nr:MATE family efflux transporter [Sphingomonas alpina]QNQ08989.1 MATE family efflux transporter [Sphingomonas alpina]